MHTIRGINTIEDASEILVKRVSLRKRCRAKHKSSVTPKDQHHPREYRSGLWPYWRRSSAYCGWNLSGAWYVFQLWERADHHQKRAAVSKNFGPMGTHNNARPHSATLTQEILAQMYWTALEHPPYSPDLSLCNYHMFGPLKEALGDSVSMMMSRSRILYASGYSRILLNSTVQE